jgi:hypothetical protein
VRTRRKAMILDDNIITKDMLVKNTYEGNYYAKKNAVMYDLQNGKQNVVCFCDNIYTAQGIVEGLNMLDKLEADGVELKNNKDEALDPNNKYVLKDGKIEIVYGDKTKDSNE